MSLAASSLGRARLRRGWRPCYTGGVDAREGSRRTRGGPTFRAWILGVLLLGCADPAEVVAPIEAEDGLRAAEFRSTRVTQTLDAASDIVRTRGFAASTLSWRGFLVDHAADVREQSMRAGTCYVILAAASPGMRELDLRVFDSDGGEIVQDGADGARAAVRFCPSQSGTYYLTLEASAGSGLFEVRTFRGPTGLDVRTDDVFREASPSEPL